MKRIFTLLIILLGTSNLLNAQFVSYETQSKWIFGFNVGGTWSTTDVKYKTYGGWGMTLGRSFNYDYGRRLSFDIRGRYLGGTWYGQAYDSTDLSNYQGASLLPYKDSLGFSVNNFQATVHELSLELVLHANGLRERSKWDPYIFGGIGLTWHQTYGDLRLNDTLGQIYGYDQTQLSKPYVNSLMDQIYETALDGTTKNQYRVGIMPSLGFGIGYQVAPRVTIGLEHKSTFTQIDDFDGFVRESKYKQDIYHYTSGFVQVRFKARDHRTIPPPTPTGNTSTTNTSNVTSTSECLSPVINIIQPASSGLNSVNISYTLIASISNIQNRQEITFKVNGVNNLNYTYNPQTDRFESNVVLNQGSNTFELTASNACGSATQSTSVSYSQCQLPTLTRLTPTTAVTSVNTPSFAFSLNTQHVTESAGISITINNRSWTGYTLNPTNGQVNGTTTLQPGENVFVIKATNACGTVTETFTVNYQQCVAPAISMVVPTGPAPTVTQASFAFTASIQHVNSSQGVKVKFNNQLLSGVNYTAAGGNLSGTVTLIPGINTFEITATNECGSDVETFTVNYQNCIPPVISMTSPTTSGTTVNSAAFTLSCAIQHATAQGITVLHNNRSITNFNYNASNGTLQSTLTLLAGLNTFVITTTNGCGTDTETITMNFLDCVAPNITLLNPTTSGTMVTTPTYLFKATIFNAGNAQNVVLKQNGTVVNGVNFNSATNQVQAFLTLNSGTNTLVLSASNACGMDAETTVINYNECIAPVLTVTNPTISGITVTQSSFSLSGTVTGLTGIQQLQVLQNSQQLSGVSLTGNAYSVNATLVPGANTFVIKATNGCGTDTKTIIVQYNNCTPPVISLVSPLNGSTNTTGSVQINAQIANANNSNAPTIMVNNRSIVLSGYNATNGSLQMNVPLVPGQNTITLNVTNACGTDTETINIFYDNCIPPVITLTSPINGSTTTSNSVQINAQVANANGSNLSVTVNNRSVVLSGYNPTTGTLQMGVPLIAGQNTITITVTNGCGSDTETITITYQQEEQKIKICHYPPGNTGNPQTIEIPASAWPTHEAHGDKLGPCPQVIPNSGATQGSGILNNSGGLGGHTGNQGGSGTSETGSGSVSTDGNSNGNSVGTGVGRPGGSEATTGGSGSTTGTGSGNANGASGSGSTSTGGSTSGGSVSTGGTTNGNSVGTGVGRPGTGTTNSGTGGSGGNTPAPTANPGNNGNSGTGSSGTGNKTTTKSTGTPKVGNTKPGQTQKTEESKPNEKTEPTPEKPEEKAPEKNAGDGGGKSGGGL